MPIASQKYDHFYFNCSGKHSYKSELKKLKDTRKDKIDKFNGNLMHQFFLDDLILIPHMIKNIY